VSYILAQSQPEGARPVKYPSCHLRVGSDHSWLPEIAGARIEKPQSQDKDADITTIVIHSIGDRELSGSIT